MNPYGPGRWGGDDWGGQGGRRQRDWTDTMQVCEDGHKITAYAVSEPESQKKRCPACGAATLMACPSCNTPIPGYRHMVGVASYHSDPPPAHCDNCGKAFPWKEKLEVIESEKAKKKEKKVSDANDAHSKGGHTFNIGTAVASPFMLDSPGASQKVTVTFTADSADDLKFILKGLLGSLDDLGLSDPDKESVKDDAEYLKKKLGSEKPESGLVKECLNGIKKKLAEAAAAAASSQIASKAGHYLELVTDFVTKAFGG